MTKPILIYGSISAIFGILGTILMYNGFLGVFSSALLAMVVSIIILVLGARSYRSSNNGYASFKEIFLVVLGIAMFGTILGLVLNYGYNMSLSEESKAVIKENYVASGTAIFDMMGQEVPLEHEESLEESAEALFDMKAALLGLPFVLIVNIIIAVIIGLIMKKEEPLELT